MELLAAIDILLSQPGRKMEAKHATCYWLIKQTTTDIVQARDYNNYALQRAAILQGEKTKYGKPTHLPHDSHKT